MTTINQWGPALLVCFTILLGIIINNLRVSDFRIEMNNRITDLKSEMNSRFSNMNNRFTDLKDFIHSENKRLEDRIERLEHPIYKA
jgi:hypothetical protein